jgi:hypothetical protein
MGLALVPVLQRLAAPIIALLSGGSASLLEKRVLASSVEYYSVRVRVPAAICRRWNSSLVYMHTYARAREAASTHPPHTYTPRC